MYCQEEVNIDSKFTNKVFNHKTLHPKNNFIPKGLVTLERIFSKNEIHVNPVFQPKEEDVEDINIGTTEEPKTIKFSKVLLAEVKHSNMKLFNDYIDLFARKYDDISNYYTFIIEHKIPMKPGLKLFK